MSTPVTHPAAPPSAMALALRATRPLYIPTSLLPGAVGLTVAIGADGAEWWLAPPAMIALFAAHAGTNVINDVEDCARGVDGPDKLDNSRVFTTGLMPLDQGRRLALALFAAAFALGVAIAAVQGVALLAIGVAGLAAGYGYSAGPRPLKYAGLGDAVIIVVMGPLITQGAYTAVTGDGFDAAAFWVGLGPGALIAAVLAGNNLADIPGDAAAGVRTLAVRIGFPVARGLYAAAVALAYLVSIGLWVADLFGWTVMLPLATLPLAGALYARAGSARGPGDPALTALAPETARLHLLFCALLIAGVVADRA